MPNLQKRRQYLSSILFSLLPCRMPLASFRPQPQSQILSSLRSERDSISPPHPRPPSSVPHHHPQNPPSPAQISHPHQPEAIEIQNIPLSNQLRQLRMAIARKQLDRIRRHCIRVYVIAVPLNNQPLFPFPSAVRPSLAFLLLLLVYNPNPYPQTSQLFYHSAQYSTLFDCSRALLFHKLVSTAAMLVQLSRVAAMQSYYPSRGFLSWALWRVEVSFLKVMVVQCIE